MIETVRGSLTEPDLVVTRRKRESEAQPVITLVSGTMPLCEYCMEMVAAAYTEMRWYARRSLKAMLATAEQSCPICSRLCSRLWKYSSSDELEVRYIIHGFTGPAERVSVSVGGFKISDVRFYEVDDIDEATASTSEDDGVQKTYENTGDTSLIDVRSWIETCNSIHSCRAGSRTDYVPPRLLCCDEGHLRIVDTLQESIDRRADYVALSYCLGDSSIAMMLDEKVLPQWSKAVEFVDMPKTFRDAVLIVQKIGLKYLWVDSLCIIQRGPGHRHDWNRHVAEMEKIYEHSYLCIAASASENSTGGCFRQVQPCLRTPCSVRIDGEKTFMLELVDHGDVSSFQLNQRAWMMQEYMLSCRIVHYSAYDVVWSVRSRRLLTCIDKALMTTSLCKALRKKKRIYSLNRLLHLRGTKRTLS